MCVHIYIRSSNSYFIISFIVPMPEIIICPKKDVAVFPNDNFTMSCLALSFGSLKYNWSKREGLLPPRAKVSFKYISHKATNVYNLEVYNVQPSDEGSYCCKATNEGGSSVCCAWLEVNSKSHYLCIKCVTCKDEISSEIFIFIYTVILNQGHTGLRLVS